MKLIFISYYTIFKGIYQHGKIQKPTAESVTQATGIAIQKLTGMQPKNQEALSAILLDIFTAEYEKMLEDAHEQ